MKITHIKKLLTVSGFILATCLMQNAAMAQQKNDPKFNKMMADSFRAEGIAGLDRIQQDETQKFCSDPVFSSSKPGEKMREKIQKINMASIKQPLMANILAIGRTARGSLRAVAVQPGLIRLTL